MHQGCTKATQQESCQSISWQLDQGEHPHEACYLKLDYSKAKSHLDWRPRWNLEHALEMIVAWQRAYLAGQDMHEFALKQIAVYQEQATS